MHHHKKYIYFLVFNFCPALYVTDDISPLFRTMRHVHYASLKCEVRIANSPYGARISPCSVRLLQIHCLWSRGSICHIWISVTRIGTL